MLFRETIAVHCEDHMEHTNTLCKQSAESLNVNADGTYNYHCVLNSSHCRRNWKEYSASMSSNISKWDI
jgi:hypothetical protein